jgi:hypothetical protein
MLDDIEQPGIETRAPHPTIDVSLGLGSFCYAEA